MSDRYTKVGNYYVRRPQAVKVGPEQVGFWEVVRLTAFVLFMFAAIVYAGPILLEGLLS